MSELKNHKLCIVWGLPQFLLYATMFEDWRLDNYLVRILKKCLCNKECLLIVCLWWLERNRICMNLLVYRVPLIPWEVRILMDRSRRSNSIQFHKYSKKMNPCTWNFLHQTIRYLTVCGQILPLSSGEGDSKVVFKSCTRSNEPYTQVMTYLPH